mmetsp:Transcript_28532/g.45924  ORF Transcript_28532/g.45924 Transcript_28532/m.45924 type:complete len:185 (-) Transcript_28532:157-711(-)
MGSICGRTTRGSDNVIEECESDDQDVADNNYGIDPKAAIEAHNHLRAFHGAPPLTWDEDLATHAVMAAHACLMDGRLHHNNAAEYCEGQNIFSKTTIGKANKTGAKQAVQSWYDEIQNYDFDNPGLDAGTGHFTQVVWKGTTKVGMAKVTTQVGQTETCYIIANYSEAGNLEGEFEENVDPPQE